MTRNKLKKLWKELARLRAGVQRAREIQAFAKKVGRRSVLRGKEPAWESIEFPSLNSITIPDHGSKDLSTGVQRQLLDYLEDDLLAFEERLDEEEKNANKG